MRHVVMGIALSATCVTAQAQNVGESAWGFFEAPDGSNGAGVQASNGAQLILKCDKPGKRSVYAVVVTPHALVPPTASAPFQMRPIELRFDTRAPVDERWRFYERSAVAIDQSQTKALTRFLNGLAGAQTVRVRMNPERARYIEENFEVGGAGDAIAKVYELCGDDSPVLAS
jgi:hypothetical protein